MQSILKKYARILSLILVISIVIPCLTIQANAGIIDELLNISFYHFYYKDSKGTNRTEQFYNWGSEDAEKNGIKIEITGVDTIKLTVDTNNEFYKRCKPELVWVHMGDGLMDITKYTDEPLWYQNKLNNGTYLLLRIPNESGVFSIDIDVPMKMNLRQVGILDGGYYETDFYSADRIPYQLMFAYEAQAYSLEELEEYMETEMADNIEEYYNADSGFRSNPNGMPFRNSDYPDGYGNCAGISTITTAKYNGYNIPTEYETSKGVYSINESYTWYDAVYGSDVMYNIKLEDTEFLEKNSSEGKYYPLERFDETYINDDAFYQLLAWAHLKNNTAAFLGGNVSIGGFEWQNLENRWSIIDYVATYLRDGKAVVVNISGKDGGHAIVGYRMEQIDEDTYRMYCYDNNFPNDKIPMKSASYKGNNPGEIDSSTGAYKHYDWVNGEVYIDFTKVVKTVKRSGFGQKEIEIFKFDSTHTSVPETSDTGLITFSLYNGEKVGVFNYGNSSNEIISYKAYPVIKDDKTVEIRTFAFYKSGRVQEITNSANTVVKMNYNYLGWYKIKDSKITLTKKDYTFDNNGTNFIECYVSHDNHGDSFGQINVRIPVGK